MIPKIIITSYLALSFLILLISLTPWQLKSKIRFYSLIKLVSILGLILQIGFTFVSSFYTKHINFYNEINKVINNIPAALCALLILLAFLLLEIPCAAKFAHLLAKLNKNFSIDNMPSKVRQIHNAELNKRITSDLAIERQETLQKKINFFERMSYCAKTIYKISIENQCVVFINFVLSILASKFLMHKTLKQAFIRSAAITTWNQIIFTIPFVILCISILITCNFTKELNKPVVLKINKKMREYKKSKKNTRKIDKKIKPKKEKINKKSKNQKDAISLQKNSVSEKLITIELGYGLLKLNQKDEKTSITELINEISQTYPSLPKITIRDNINLSTWEYTIFNNTKKVSLVLEGTEAYDIILLRIYESLQSLYPQIIK